MSRHLAFFALLVAIVAACANSPDSSPTCACPDAGSQRVGSFIPGQGGSPTGAAGGDLAGTYPNPTVAQVTGATTPASAGMIRMPKNTAINARNFNNTADINLLSTDGSNDITIGDLTNPTQTVVEAHTTVALAANTVGNGGAEIAVSFAVPPSASIEFLPDQTLDGTSVVLGGSGIQFFATGTDLGAGTGMIGISEAGVDPSGTLANSGNMLIYARHGGDGLAGYSSAGVTWGLVPVGATTANTQKMTWMPFSAPLHTTSSSAATIWTSPSIPASHVLTIMWATFQTIDTFSLGQSAAGQIAGTFVNSAGTVSQLGSTTVSYNHAYATPPAFTISGTTVLLKVSPLTANASDSQVGGMYALD